MELAHGFLAWPTDGQTEAGQGIPPKGLSWHCATMRALSSPSGTQEESVYITEERGTVFGDFSAGPEP